MRRVLLWSSLVFTSVAIAVAAGLGIDALKTEAANATNGVSVVLKLALPDPIDQAARSKYLADRAAKAEQEAMATTEKLAKTTTSATQTVAKSTKTTRPTVSKPVTTQPATPTCDRLIIPKIGLDACLATVGLTTGGAVDVHNSLPAWFNQSSRAGTNSGKYSATFIDGHCSGIFKNLGRLAVGDTVTVAFMSGESYIYTVRVTETVALAQVDMLKALSIYGSANQGLNLMTCDGAYNANAGTAERRLIIYATR